MGYLSKLIQPCRPNPKDETKSLRKMLMQKIFPEQGRLRWDFCDPNTGKPLVAGASAPNKNNSDYVFSINYFLEGSENKHLLVQLNERADITVYFPITETKNRKGNWITNTDNGDKEIIGDLSDPNVSVEEKEIAMIYVTQLFEEAVSKGAPIESSHIDPIIGSGPQI